MRRSLALPFAMLAIAASGCAAGGARPFTIGVLADCTGVLGAFNELELASAELPLLLRGGRLDGSTLRAGVSDAHVAGRRVHLVTGCAESTTYEVLIAEARRLVENEHVDVLIGPPFDSDGLVLREIARQSPNVTFVLTLSRAQETTLRNPAPNVFRFQADGAQQTAGLGSYTYDRLGWRSAAVVGDDWSASWARAAGFIAEFCALGGRIAARMFPPIGGAGPAVADRIPGRVDGIAILPSVSFADWSPFLKAYRRRESDLGRHVVLGPDLLITARSRARLARLARGAVAAGSEPFGATNPAWLRLRREFDRHFPGVLQRNSVPLDYPLALAYRNASEAILEALERVEGDLNGGQRRFMAALTGLRLKTPTGVVRLDANRQAVLPTYLTRIGVDGHGQPQLRTVRVVRDVEQTFGGYFSASDAAPSPTSPRCHRASPPEWAS